MDWTLRPVNRPMIFLGRKLFHISTPLYVCDTHFSKLPADPDALRLPLEADGAAGALVPSQPVAGDLPRFGRRGTLLRYVPSHYDRFVLRKEGTFADYLAKFSRKTRYNLQREVRKLGEAAGRPDFFRLYRGEAEMAEFLRHADAIARRTYQARLFDAQLEDTPAMRARIAELARRDATVGALLWLGDSPVAFWWFTREGDVLVSEYTGYDAAHRKLSPGTVLLYLVLEQLFFPDARLSTLDFGEGDADYKRLFSTGSQRCAHVLYLRATPANAAVVSLESALWGARRALKPVEAELQRRGWKARLKRILRG